MGTGLQQIMKQLRALSYQDMMVLAGELAKTIESHKRSTLDATAMATALLSLSVGPVESSEQTKTEEEILAKVFSRRRQISVARHNTGWQIEVPTLPASQVMGTELRPMFPMLLDQLVTMHVLTRGGRD